MPSDDNQRLAHAFFLEHMTNGQTFTKDDLEARLTWKGQTFATYWSKQFSPFAVAVGTDGADKAVYRVSDAFRRYRTWRRFKAHVTQVRSVASTSYSHHEFGIVRVYEFFMPLTNEHCLREALDALFYKDTLIARIRAIPQPELHARFESPALPTDEAYLDYVCSWAADHFGGYSISHVSGRFRAGDLTSRADASQATNEYLVDETTAVARFIFPCESEAEADLVAFLFERLFVTAVLEVVNGEDEIWMLESGLHNRLHVWKVGSQ